MTKRIVMRQHLERSTLICCSVLLNDTALLQVPREEHAQNGQAEAAFIGGLLILIGGTALCPLRSRYADYAQNLRELACRSVADEKYQRIEVGHG